MIFLSLLLFSSIGVMWLKHENEKVITMSEGKYDSLFKKYAKDFNIPDWRILKAIAYQESSLGENNRVKAGLVSYDGLSWGIMQIAPNIGSPKEIEIKGPLDISKLNNPDYNISKGAELVGYLWGKYKDRYKVFLAYNQGERNTDNGKDYTVKHTKGGYGNVVEGHYQRILKGEL